ncbi:MAG TPA: DUF2959 domain-containing protein [bacterium]|nr:DUF2959 domain-containing protein [bacterium]HQG44527.1 DUF2959 domain-containing protein [bacterium]HQJ63987.1 DUF2959 domain-containing protein [bacterium]
MKNRLLILFSGFLTLCSCSTLYFAGMEKIGIQKREIMADRVKAARDTQKEAKEQFVSALEQFKSVVAVQGGDLEKKYNELNATLKKSEAEADAVHSRIKSVEEVSDALFEEWRAEIAQYSSDKLRQASQRKYDAAEARYRLLIGAMKKAESRLEPALIPLRDQVLFMKHNLNARAIAGLSDEVVTVETRVDSLVADIEVAVKEADAFIATLQEEE